MKTMNITPILVHLPAPAPDRVGVAEFVERLDHGIDQPEDDDVLRKKHAVREVRG